MKKYEVGIEYGPTAADVHYVTVNADSIEDALNQGKKWAEDNKIRGALVCNADEVTEDSDYTDIIEWTPEEEEAFLSILEDEGDDNGII